MRKQHIAKCCQLCATVYSAAATTRHKSAASMHWAQTLTVAAGLLHSHGQKALDKLKAILSLNMPQAEPVLLVSRPTHLTVVNAEGDPQHMLGVADKTPHTQLHNTAPIAGAAQYAPDGCPR
jgi:hypothetical protein